MEKFQQLNEDKQQRILNAALEEFSKKGYFDASTNLIAQAAGISKGALFHYFGNKKKLYHFLVSYTASQMEDKILKDIPETNDLIELFRALAERKAQLAKAYPLMFDFMYRVFLEQPEDAEYYGLVKQTMTLMNELMSDRIDTTRFRPGIDLPQAIEICTWMSEGFGRKYSQVNEGINPDDMMNQAQRLFDLLRTMIYEEE